MIRAGDVHREMGLTSAMPAVCSAIGRNKCGELAQAKVVQTRKVRRTAPMSIFIFSLNGGPSTGRMNANSLCVPHDLIQGFCDTPGLKESLRTYIFDETKVPSAGVIPTMAGSAEPLKSDRIHQ